MRRAAVIMVMVLFGLSQAAGAADSSESQKSKESKGITVEDLGRGLKSAGESVSKEIPKIGPAIGETFKKITGKDSEKGSSQDSEKKKK